MQSHESDTNDRSHTTILLVEDEALITLSQKSILERNDYAVITSFSAEEAIKTVNEEEIHLILMDIDLGRGKMDGTEAAEIILREHELPIVFLTNHTEREMVDRVKGITRYGFVLKNAGEFVLIESIQMAFELYDAHRKTRNHEERYHRLVDNSPDMIYRMSLPDGRYEYISRAVEAISGYPPEDWYDNPRLIQTVIHPDWRTYFQDQWENLLKGEMPPTYEYQIIHKNGSIRWINQRNVLVKDEDGTPVAIEGIVTDITDRNLAKEALENEKHLFQVLFDSLPDSVYFKDDAHRFLRVNKAKAAEQDTTPDQMIGQTDFNHFPDHLAAECEQDDKRVLKTGNPIINKEEELILKNSTRWVSTTKLPLRDKQGSIIGTMGISRDITHRKSIQNSLEVSETQKKAILNSISTVLVFVDKNFNIIWANKAAAESVNKQEKQLKGHHCYQYWGFTGKACDNCPVERALKTGKTQNSFQTSPDGRMWKVTGEPVFDAEGTLIGALDMAEDITDQKESERKLKKALEQKNTLMKETHHRIKNNFAMVSSLINLHSDIERDRESRQRLKNLKNQILSMAMIHEQLYQSDESSKTSFKGIIQGITSSLFSESGLSTVKVVLDIEDFKVDIGVAVPLGLVVNELTTNALKYGFTSEGPQAFSITMKKDKQKKHYILNVKNTGKPFPETIDFKNPESMGLKLVGLFVDQLNGSMELNREDGAEFIITFPILS